MPEIQIIILAGGKGTRLKPLTSNIPKCMIKINKKPFIFYLLKYLLAKNFKEIIISSGYKSQVIRSYLKSSKNFKKHNIKIINDNPKNLGTGGAIKNCLKYLKKNFFIMYGDSMIKLNFNKIYENFVTNKKNFLMTIYYNKNKYDKSNVEINKKNIIINYDKHSKIADYIDYGLMCANKKIFSEVKLKKFDLSYIIKKQIKNKDISTFITKKRFHEIGTKQSLNEFKNYIKKYETQ